MTCRRLEEKMDVWEERIVCFQALREGGCRMNAIAPRAVGGEAATNVTSRGDEGRCCSRPKAALMRWWWPL